MNDKNSENILYLCIAVVALLFLGPYLGIRIISSTTTASTSRPNIIQQTTQKSVQETSSTQSELKSIEELLR